METMIDTCQCVHPSINTRRLQVQDCSKKQEKCLKELNYNYSSCLHNCEGLLVTSLMKSDPEPDLETMLPSLVDQYEKYKKFVKFPVAIKSKVFCLLKVLHISIIFLHRV